MEHKDMIDEDKLENIKDDMEHFLNEPHDDENRDVLTSEYQQIMADINYDLEEERIENLKKVESSNTDPKDEKLAVFDNINTEDNMVQANETDTKKGKNKNTTDSSQQSKHGNFKDQETMQKKKSVNKDYSEDKYSSEHKQQVEFDEKSQESEAKESVIIKKVTKTKDRYKHQQQNVPPPVIEEPEKPKELPKEMDLEEALKPTPIITHSTRTSRDLGKRKKSIKKANVGKNADNILQVDSQNFPALGQTTPPIEENVQAERKSSKKREQAPKSPVVEKLDPPRSIQPPPVVKTMYDSKTPVLDILDASYNRKREEYEQTGDQSIAKLSESALFLIFYYMQGTYNQVLAGEELTRRSWQYKSKFQTWFRKNDKGDRSKGDIIYFDFGSDWTTKIVKFKQ